MTAGALPEGLGAVVYLNGRLVPASQARVSVFDRGFLFGDGVFETVRAYGGRIFQAEAHYARLVRSAHGVGIPVPFDEAGFGVILRKTLGRHGDALVRLTITRGEGLPVPAPEGCGPPTVVAVARAAPPGGREAFHRGIALVTGPYRTAPPGTLDPAAKTTSYLGSILALADARRHGADESLRLNPAGEVAEGSMSNLFGVWSGALVTPPEDAGILPGITRAVVLGLAREEGLAVAERTILPAELDFAEELFVTSSGWEVMPVTRLDGRSVGTGAAGPVATRLHRAFRAAVAAACGAAMRQQGSA